MNDALQTIHTLRTVHGSFAKKPISDDDLNTILGASVRAANASARQSYSIIVVDPDIRKELRWAGAEVLLYCVDFNRLTSSAAHIGESFDAGSFLPFLTGVVDTCLAVQTAVIAAKSLGIDSMISNGVYRAGAQDKVRTALRIPEKGCFPLLQLCLGYPRGRTSKPKGRLTDLGVVHRGKYRPLTSDQLDEVVSAYDKPSRRLCLGNHWKKAGFPHYLSWFFSEWSKNVETSAQSKQLLETLKESGFLPDSSAAQ